MSEQHLEQQPDLPFEKSLDVCLVEVFIAVNGKQMLCKSIETDVNFDWRSLVLATDTGWDAEIARQNNVT